MLLHREKIENSKCNISITRSVRQKRIADLESASKSESINKKVWVFFDVTKVKFYQIFYFNAWYKFQNY